MSSRVVDCPQCGGSDFKVLNPEVVDNVKAAIANVDAMCNICKAEFSYSAATTWGRQRGILY
jgi:hypothetical protein